MFEDLGLKYLGPVDGHDLEALETAFALARGFDGPVIVHCVTRKGYGYAPAENDEADQMHQSRGFDPETGVALASTGRTWTSVFADELVRLGEQRDDIVAITAAMCEPTGLGEFSRRFPDRTFDVGIAEQHAVTSAAGLASGGLHPVVAVYATFLNRAFDQVLLDVALHRLPVTFVLDRAGITGEDGPSHNGVWDLADPRRRARASASPPRATRPRLRAQLREAVAHADGPTVVRFPKTPLGADIPARAHASAASTCSPSTAPGDGRRARRRGRARRPPTCWPAAEAVRGAGFTVRVVDPRWVTPVDPALVELARARPARRHRRGRQRRPAVSAPGSPRRWPRPGSPTPVRQIGVPARFPDHGAVADVKSWAGLTGQDIGRRIVEWAVLVVTSSEPDTTSRPPSIRSRDPQPLASDRRRREGGPRCGSSSLRTKCSWPRPWRAACAARAWPSTSPPTATTATARRR